MDNVKLSPLLNQLHASDNTLSGCIDAMRLMVLARGLTTNCPVLVLFQWSCE